CRRPLRAARASRHGRGSARRASPHRGPACARACRRAPVRRRRPRRSRCVRPCVQTRSVRPCRRSQQCTGPARPPARLALPPARALATGHGCRAGGPPAPYWGLIHDPRTKTGPERRHTRTGRHGDSGMEQSAQADFDAIVIGAGVAGIYQIKRLVDLGLRATVLEAAPDLGGTWYNNRYPGARFDSESYTYGYTFSKEVLAEWHWKEHFSPQPENLSYLNFLADRLDLRRHMQFNCRVDAAHFDNDTGLWRLRVSDGRELTCRFVIMAIGLLSTPTLPRIPG